LPSIFLFIFFCEKENEPKEIARATLVSCASRSGRELWKLASLRQSTALFPPAPAMLGASQWEFENQLFSL
jgi:hypothetical protein